MTLHDSLYNGHWHFQYIFMKNTMQQKKSLFTFSKNPPINQLKSKLIILFVSQEPQLVFKKVTLLKIFIWSLISNVTILNVTQFV